MLAAQGAQGADLSAPEKVRYDRKVQDKEIAAQRAKKDAAAARAETAACQAQLRALRGGDGGEPLDGAAVAAADASAAATKAAAGADSAATAAAEAAAAAGRAEAKRLRKQMREQEAQAAAREQELQVCIACVFLACRRALSRLALMHVLVVPCCAITYCSVADGARRGARRSRTASRAAARRRWGIGRGRRRRGAGLGRLGRRQ